jgi:hypothetical protein
MDDPGLDHALETATKRTKEAEERLLETPPDSPAIVRQADTVQWRAEDLHELAEDAAQPHSSESAGEPGT